MSIAKLSGWRRTARLSGYSNDSKIFLWKYEFALRNYDQIYIFIYVDAKWKEIILNVEMNQVYFKYVLYSHLEYKYVL